MDTLLILQRHEMISSDHPEFPQFQFHPIFPEPASIQAMDVLIIR